MKDAINKMLISGVVYMWGAGFPLGLILLGIYHTQVSGLVSLIGFVTCMLAGFSLGMIKKHRAMQDLDDSLGDKP